LDQITVDIAAWLWLIAIACFVSTFIPRFRVWWAERTRLSFLRFGLGVAVVALLVVVGAASPPEPGGARVASKSASPARMSQGAKATENAVTAPSVGVQVEQTYTDSVRAEGQIIGESMDEWVSLMSSPQPMNEAWRLKVAEQLATWKTEYEKAEALRPPPEWSNIHAHYLAALAQLNAAANDYAQGLDDSNPSEIREANSELRNATTQIKEVTRRIVTLEAEH
jgi:hypothetical protein